MVQLHSTSINRITTILFILWSMCDASSTEIEFEQWALQNGRVYQSNEEKEHRRHIFTANLARIQAHNVQSGPNGWKMALNKFADVDINEWKQLFTGGYIPDHVKATTTEDDQEEDQRPVIPSPSSALEGSSRGSSSSNAHPKRLRRAQTTQERSSSESNRINSWPWFSIPSGAAAAAPQAPELSPRATPRLDPISSWASASSTSIISTSSSASPFPSANQNDIPNTTPLPSVSSAPRPESIDWSDAEKYGVMTPIRNQGSCGACFALAAAAALESATAIVAWKKLQAQSPSSSSSSSSSSAASSSFPSLVVPVPLRTPPTPLSEQQLLDCGTGTCAGGGMRATWNYIRDAGGMCSWEAYPYKLEKGDTCLADYCVKLSTVSGYRSVIRQSQQALEYAVSLQPVVVPLQADEGVFMFYSGGIMDAPCGTTINHAAVVVGYGEAEVVVAEQEERETPSSSPSTLIPAATAGAKKYKTKKQKYWKIRNSWGNAWGENGYIRIARGSEWNGALGQCGIQTDPTLPTAAEV